jgi:hypothetical protein
VIVYGIVGQTFTAGIGLSPVVERAARTVLERVADEALALLRGAIPGNGADTSDQAKEPLDTPWLL